MPLLTSWPALFFYAFFLFFLKNYFTLDPDFGWHITLGKSILIHGIPHTDPFSYSMPSFPFVDHEWLTNIVMYLLFKNIGIFGMAVLWSLFVSFSLFIVIFLVPQTYRAFEKMFFLLASISLLAFIGIRTQVLSWLFFVLLIFFLFKKNRYVQLGGSALLFLCWVNMHGSFPVGLILIFLAAILQKQKKLWILLVVCCTFTFINPYGARLWGEVWNQISDASLRFSIAEWFPSVLYPTFFTLWLFLGVVIVLSLSNWKKIYLYLLIVYVLFVLLGISSIRHMPFALVVGIPLGGQALFFLQEKAKKILFGTNRFHLAHTVFIIFSVSIICIQITISHFFIFSPEIKNYPNDEVAYLQKHLPTGNVLSIYDWGGYLIWKLPEKKVFIDGRMPSWRWHAPKTESNDAFVEMKNLFLKKESIRFFVKKYHITDFLLPKENSNNKEEISFITEIKKEGYIVIFRGAAGVIYEKK